MQLIIYLFIILLPAKTLYGHVISANSFFKFYI